MVSKSERSELLFFLKKVLYDVLARKLLLCTSIRKHPRKRLPAVAPFASTYFLLGQNSKFEISPFLLGQYFVNVARFARKLF